MNSKKIYLCGSSGNLNKKIYDKLKSNKDINVIRTNEIKIEDIIFDNYYKIIFIIDSFYIEKNINLIMEILEINNNLILCLKNNNKIKIDINKLSSLLKINVIDEKNINLIMDLIMIDNYERNDIECEEIESYINDISVFLPPVENKKYIAIKLLEGDKSIINQAKEKFNIDLLTIELNDYLRNINFEEMKDKKYIKENDICNTIIEETITYKKQNDINKILSNKIFGIFITILFLLLIIISTIMLYNIITIPFLNLNLSFIYNNNNIFIIGLKSIYLYIFMTFISSIFILVFYELIKESGILSLIMFHLDKIFSKFKSSGKMFKLYLDKYLLNEPINIDLYNKEEKNIFILSSIFYPSLNKFVLIIFLINIFFPNIKFLSLTYILFLIFLILVFISLMLSKIIPVFEYKNNLISFNIEIPKLKLPIIDIKSKIKKVFIKKIMYSFLIGIILHLLSSFNLNIYEIIIISYILSFVLNETTLIFTILLYFNIKKIDYIMLKSLLINNGWNIKEVLSILILFIFNLPNIYNLKIIKKETYFKHKWLIIISPLIISMFLILVLFI